MASLAEEAQAGDGATLWNHSPTVKPLKGAQPAKGP